jgi:drug/metabolite transporter (DMT)-like permease
MQNREKSKTLKSNILLLLASAIWGFAFVAQKKGAEFLGPFAFNGIRFALGSLSLIPLMMYFKGSQEPVKGRMVSLRSALAAGVMAGLILFAGAALQQAGMTGTTAGKAGFITGLYMIFVPLIGILFKHNIDAATIAGAFLATAGMYLLCVKEEFAISYYDGLVLLYGGFCSVGIAYTLQVVGQKNAKPSHAAIILSMEAVFAAVGGFIILDEKL